jgi:hypothetical protein
MNQLRVVALNEGLQRKKALWRRGKSQATGVVAASSIGRDDRCAEVTKFRKTKIRTDN